MKYLLCIVAVFASANSVPVNVNNAVAPSPAIVGGTQAAMGEFPSMVIVNIPQRSLHCGGSLISRQDVITAAHCLVDADSVFFDYQWIKVIAGDLDLITPSADRVERNVIYAFIHPDFNPYTNENDLAILRINEPFPFPHNTIDPIPIRRRSVRRGTLCSFAGWGHIAIGGGTNVLLNRINLPVLSHEVCNEIINHMGSVAESMLCAGSIVAQVPPVGVCNGNEGGGLFCEHQLAGILSFGVGCGQANNPAVFTQIRFYSEWIDEQVSTAVNATESVWSFESINSRRLRRG